MTVVEAKVGDVVGGRYRLDAEIGRGGHGLVFRAFDDEAGMFVALKILNPKVTADPQYMVRLWREAQSLATLWGSSVVQVYGFGSDEQRGFIYMSMELLQGDTFADFLFDLEGFGHFISGSRLLEVLDPVARALRAAHERGITHRDVKPSNIIVLYPEVGGGTRLMDFGLAKIDGAMSLTKAGTVAGSPSYIAPEVWQSQPFDHRIDVYAFGAVIYRALTGRPPFLGATPVDILMAATTEPRPALSQWRPEFGQHGDRWVHRALALDPDQRHPTVHALWSEFRELVAFTSAPPHQWPSGHDTGF